MLWGLLKLCETCEDLYVFDHMPVLFSNVDWCFADCNISEEAFLGSSGPLT